METGVGREEVEVGQERRILQLREGIFRQRLGLQPGGRAQTTPHASGQRLGALGARGGRRHLARVTARFPRRLRGGGAARAGHRLFGGLAGVLQDACAGRLPVGRLSLLRLPFVLHASVLEPHFDLPLGEVQQGRDLDAARPAQVLVKVEFLLQLQQLRVGVSRAQPARPAAGGLRQSRAICRESGLGVRAGRVPGPSSFSRSEDHPIRQKQHQQYPPPRASRLPEPFAPTAFPFFPGPLSAAASARVRAKHSESRPRTMQGLGSGSLLPPKPQSLPPESLE